MRDQIIKAVCKIIESKGISLDARAFRLITGCIENLNPKLEITTEVIENIAKHLSVELTKTKSFEHQLQTEEDSDNVMTKYKIRLDDTVNTLLHKPAVLQSIFNPAALVSKTYLFLDSKWRLRNGDQTILSWSIATSNGSRLENISGLTTAPVKNIIAVKLLPFIFPNTQRALNSLRRISVEMIEFNAQAYVMHGNQRFHFMYEIDAGTAADDPYETKELGLNESIFRFTYPITEIQTLSIRFRNPINILSLDKDILIGTAASVGTDTVITFSEPHRCGIGDDVVVSGFTTTNPSADFAEIELVNDADGWPLTAVTTYTITFAVDLSTLTGAITGNVEVFFQAKRLLLRFEIDWVQK